LLILGFHRLLQGGTTVPESTATPFYDTVFSIAVFAFAWRTARF
jgi:hypothetical protein